MRRSTRFAGWWRPLAGICLGFAALAVMPRVAQAASAYVVLHTFSNTDGTSPSSPLVKGSDGRLYGSTAINGAGGVGTLFAIATDGGLTTLHDFSGADGASPNGPLVMDDVGTLYGVTEYGGDNDTGTVFSLTPAGQFTSLHSFPAWSDSGNAEGIAPRGSLVRAPDGSFYGTTTRGGANDSGTLFRITATGALTTLYAFNSFHSGSADGALPATTLVFGKDGNLYGTTAAGGTQFTGSLAPGTLFRLTTAGQFTALHSFNSATDGASPSGLAAGSDGSLYGATATGGSNGSGTLFKATPDGRVTTLYSFSKVTVSPGGYSINADGAFPVSGVTLDRSGNLYGTTAFGGPNGTGTIFRRSPDGTVTTLYTFGATFSMTNSDGAVPVSALINGSDGSFYGAAAAGGQNGAGTLYKLTLPASSVTGANSGTGGNSGGGGAMPLSMLAILLIGRQLQRRRQQRKNRNGN